MNRAALERRAEEIAPGILAGAGFASRRIVESLRNDWRVTSRAEVLFGYEFLVLLLHLVDRTVFGTLGATERAVFMDRLLAEVLNALSTAETDIGTASASVGHVVELYNVRGPEYSRFREWVPNEGEPWAGTLFWEFANHAAVALGLNASSEASFRVFLAVSAYAPELLEALKLRSLAG